MKGKEIRKKFINYFESKLHRKFESSSLIPANDPTLLFANAGMNQFKEYFTGVATPTNKRAVTIQKCVRAGGKHNDLENVGYTARHHTFFEMLGNFSFGDYFKEDAIKFAWEFLTKELSIPSDRLYVTVHDSDDEAFQIWNKQIGLPPSKIFRKGDKDNFWEMGEFGPCGPCSEIFYDHGEKYATPGFDPSKARDILEDELRYVEIWNLVFMQYEKSPSGTTKLPKPSIDTGSGLERVAAVVQGKYWNYDTDLFAPILKAIENLTRKSYSDTKYTSSMRIVADHLRSTTMLISDGVIPSNEGRGYVLRRIIRRAVRHLRELESPKGQMHTLVESVFAVLGEEYPQNAKNADLVKKYLKIEEDKFLETLEQGIRFLKESLSSHKISSLYPGSLAFKLYDTYGFPIDLTQSILKDQNIEVDIKEFEQLMEKQKEESRKSWKSGKSIDNKIFYDIRDTSGQTLYIDGHSTELKAKLIATVTIEGNTGLVFDRTCFYGEGGGQVGDIGHTIIGGQKYNIIDTIKPIDDLYVHIVEGQVELSVNSDATLHLNATRKELIKRNHTATHLLQAALVKVLGNHVKQSGSSVEDSRLRFDFTHTAAVTDNELTQVEKIVNDAIISAMHVKINIMKKADAEKSGATALFGEKYKDDVRVISINDFSTELCGGSHVGNTSEIGCFTIIAESSLSTGIRRIEACTSLSAINRLNNRSKLLKSIELKMNANEELVTQRVDKLALELKEKSKQIEELQTKIQLMQSQNLFDNPEKLENGITYMGVICPPNSDLRKLSDQFMSKYENGVVALISKNGEKQALLIKAAKNLSGVDCSAIIKNVSTLFDAKGGGKADMAQASGTQGNESKIFDTIKTLIIKGVR